MKKKRNDRRSRAACLEGANKDVRTLFNDLVGPPNQRRREGDPESLRGPEVYSHFKADRLLHREFTWLRTFEDLQSGADNADQAEGRAQVKRPPVRAARLSLI